MKNARSGGSGTKLHNWTFEEKWVRKKRKQKCIYAGIIEWSKKYFEFT